MKSYLKLLAGIYIPIALAVLWVFAYNYTMMTATATEALQQEMKNMWELTARLGTGEAYDPILHGCIREISRKTALRITLIRPDGTVVDDSYLESNEITGMDNHGQRPEVLAAAVEGEGFSERYSRTVQQDMLYYARRLPDGMILRIAYPMTYVHGIRSQWQTLITRTLMFLLVIVALITLALARRFNRPLLALDKVADQIEADEPEIHFPSFDQPVMARISNLLYRVVTAMTQNQKKYMEEKEKLSQILATLDDAILFVDADLRVIHMNRHVSEILETQLVPGRPVTDQVTDPEILSRLRQVFHAPTDRIPDVHWKHRILDITIRKVDDKRLIVFHDVTEKSRYDLYKSELVGNITHELKTPMASILGYAETLVHNPGMSREDQGRFIGIILNHARRMNQLIEDILELHRLEADPEAAVVREPARLQALKEELSARYQSAPKQIMLELPSGETRIRHEHLFSIFTNLIDNAVKYSSGDRVTVTVELNGSELAIQVSDQGPAIPESERTRIFERFYTRSRSRNRARAGTGLGLAIVKHIARLYGGSVTVRTNAEGGNTFEVRLRVESNPTA